MCKSRPCPVIEAYVVLQSFDVFVFYVFLFEPLLYYCIIKSLKAGRKLDAKDTGLLLQTPPKNISFLKLLSLLTIIVLHLSTIIQLREIPRIL
jgi:hypothetical protein